MAPTEGPPLSLRPFPVADKSPKNISDFISRVNALPGGFRAVTESKLDEDIRALETNPDGEPEDVEMSDGDDDEETSTSDPALARNEVLKNIDIAGNIAMLTLDSLSLLLSKQSPTQAGLTLSQQLREMVGIGTMGSDKLDDSNITAKKSQESEEVAVGWTLMEINRTRDSAEEASTFLEAEMEAEGKYWEGILAVKKAGWSICKVPNERHTMGVRFGFSEAAPEFKANGLAAMRRGDDGTAELDTGRLGNTSERIVVTYEKEGQVIGRAVPHDHTGGNTDPPSLEERVLGARNTIFAQELWGELSREARSLVAYDVHPEDKRLVYEISPDTKLVIELLPVDSIHARDDSLPENAIADTIQSSLSILLTYAHRCNELMRIRPLPPHVSRSRGTQTYTLLRPIIARMMSLHSIQSCTQYVGSLVKTLKAAGLTSSTFTLRTPSYSSIDQSSALTSGGGNQISGALTLIRNMMQPIDFTIELNLLPDLSFPIRGRTYLFPVTATYYNVLPSPDSALHKICAPYADGYPDLKALASYLRTVASRALITHVLDKLRSKDEENASKWSQGIQGTSISSEGEQEKVEISVSIDENETETQVWALVLNSFTENNTEATGAKHKTESVKWTAAPHPGEVPPTFIKAVGQALKYDLS